MQREYDIERLTLLAFKHVTGSLTPAEEAELEEFLGQPGNREHFERMIDPETVEAELPIWQEAERTKEASLEALKRDLAFVQAPGRVWPIVRWGAIAAGVLGLALCWTLFRTGRRTDGPLPVTVAGYDLRPGGQKATLTLASGRQIVLDSVRKGRLDREAGAAIDKVDSGVIQYVTDHAAPAAEGSGINTLATPKGGTYEVRLPDGSDVVLNSASFLRYPTRFDGKGPREVELKGEGYFRVTHEGGRPFQVKVAGQIVEVLGTEFDVKAYADEAEIKTTLLSGGVRVSQGAGSVLLKPGEQSLGIDGGVRLVGPVDTDQVVAWKNGMFRWNGAPLEEVMRDLARWYNVQVVYKGPAPTQKLIAVVGRNLPATEVLKALEISGYHFKISGSDQIEVTP
jgi:ferric-dicitrate binding protein FerR (iron transport regulator)